MTAAASRHVVVVGDLVLDRDLVGRVDRVCPDAPVPVLDVETRSEGPGAAGLTALLCAARGAEVTVVAPLGRDRAGDQLRSALAGAGVQLIGLDQEGPTRRKTRLRSQGQSLLRMDDGGPGTPSGALPPAAVEAVREADVVLVSCYGGGVTHDPAVRSLVTEQAALGRVVWDPHPRGGEPVPGCALVTPNLAEARATSGMAHGHGDLVARRLVEAWSARAVCVTAGSAGAWLATCTGEPVHVPTTPAAGDPCGAGDAFVATVAVGMANSLTTSESVAQAVVAASEWVAAGGTSAYRSGALAARPRGEAVEVPSLPTGSRTEAAEEVAARVRARGGTLVATGGCFDILHAGHVACLEAARHLGDGLVVLLNSDASVRARKGAGRPVQSADDRAKVLLGLACVDAVMVFDEQSPESALRRLRPDVWVKGGDYEGTELPESALVRSWGGRVVLLPYRAGYSTTAILAGTGTSAPFLTREGR